MSTTEEVKETISKALDIKDDLMKHGVTNSKDAADAEEIFALKQTNVDEAIASIDPNHDQIAKALDIKDDLTKNGINVPAGEEIWREEMEKAVK